MRGVVVTNFGKIVWDQLGLDLAKDFRFYSAVICEIIILQEG